MRTNSTISKIFITRHGETNIVEKVMIKKMSKL